MFCPQCNDEYRQGFDTCSDCGVSLVAELPPVPDDERPRPDAEFATVLETADPGLLSLTKSVLDGAGIEFLSIGENAGAVFSGNPYLGRVRLQVEADRVDEVTALLSELSVKRHATPESSS